MNNKSCSFSLDTNMNANFLCMNEIKWDQMRGNDIYSTQMRRYNNYSIWMRANNIGICTFSIILNNLMRNDQEMTKK